MNHRAAIGAVLMFGCIALPRAATAELRIGVGAPLSGVDAVFGDQIRLGVEQGIADVNASGGFLGQSGRMVARDDGGEPAKAADVARSFVADKIRIVIGHFSSAATVAASAVYADAGTLDITPSAVAPIVTGRGIATMFRTCGRDDEQAEVIAHYLVARHLSRIAIVHDRTNTGKALADGVRQELAKAGVKDVFYGSLEKGARDLTGLVARIKMAGPQIVVFGGSANDAGDLVRQLREANARTPLIGGVDTASDDFTSAAGSAADGTMLVFPQDPRTRPAAADLLRRLRAKGLEPEAYVFYAYAAVQIVRQAAETANSLDPARIAAAMHAGHAFDTVLGPLAFDQAGDPTVSDYTIYVWHKGAAGRMTFDDQAKT